VGVDCIQIFPKAIISVFFDVEENSTDVDAYRLFHVYINLDSSASTSLFGTSGERFAAFDFLDSSHLV
jgi:hypothetical protein